jgi:hypothetical protein
LSILCEKDPEATELLEKAWHMDTDEDTEEKFDLSEIGLDDEEDEDQ